MLFTHLLAHIQQYIILPQFNLLFSSLLGLPISYIFTKFMYVNDSAMHLNNISNCNYTITIPVSTGKGLRKP